jgi:hypothetical protein
MESASNLLFIIIKFEYSYVWKSNELITNLSFLKVPESNNVLEGLSHPSVERSQAESFVPANDRRTTGTFAIPETVQEVVSFPRLDTRLSTY